MAGNTNLLLLFFFFFLLCFSFRSRSHKTPPVEQQELQILLQIKKDWGNPPNLDSWDPSSSSSHCQWTGIQCSDNISVTEISLYSQNIAGGIPAAICDLRNLSSIDLSDNFISGNFPVSLYNCSNLQYLDLSQNLLVGKIPSDVYRMPSTLAYLSLSANNFTGNIPGSIGRISGIQVLFLDNNLFNGTFPAEIGNLSSLERLALANNSFLPARIPDSFGKLSKLKFLWMSTVSLIGDIPDFFGDLPELVLLDLVENSLTGRIPSSIWLITKLQYLYLYKNNLSGAINATSIGAQGLKQIDVAMNQLNGSIPESFGHLQNLSILSMYFNQFSGEIPTSIGTLPALSDLRLFSNKLSGSLPPDLGKQSTLRNVEVEDNSLTGELPKNLCSDPIRMKLRICRYQSNGSDESSSVLRLLLGILCPILVMLMGVFAFFITRDYRRRRTDGPDPDTWKLTSFQSLDFNESVIVRGLTDGNVIGSGGAGTVYRIAVSNQAGGMVAVKKIWNRRKLEEKLEREFQSEVQILGSIRHTNIVKLMCCVSSRDSKLLVYEYMENGSLDRWLHGRSSGGLGRGGPLDWPTRLGIAIGAARGLCYMHHECAPPIVHRDVKSSNILLDSGFRARIADFGLARMLVKPGERDILSSAIAGSVGYMAPECAYTRRVNDKVDVYSFGVVLLELTTGRKANDGGDRGNLAEWVWQHFQAGKKLADAVDNKIGDPSYMDEIAVVIRLGLVCTGTLPSTRPTMKEVLQILLRCSHRIATSPLIEYDGAPLLQEG